MATSPFSGTPGIRYTENGEQASPAGSLVFSGGDLAPNTVGFLQGFLRPGGNQPGVVPDGLLPSILFNYTGGTSNLGDVAVSLTPPEQNLVSKFPETTRQITDILKKYGWLIWPVMFLLFASAFKRFIK